MANLEDVQDLIQEILDNPKLKYVADRLRQEYHDEPILQTASQMQRLLPRPLVEAKRLMRNPAEYHYNSDSCSISRQSCWRISPTIFLNRLLFPPAIPVIGT